MIAALAALDYSVHRTDAETRIVLYGHVMARTQNTDDIDGDVERAARVMALWQMCCVLDVTGRGGEA